MLICIHFIGLLCITRNRTYRLFRIRNSSKSCTYTNLYHQHKHVLKVNNIRQKIPNTQDGMTDVCPPWQVLRTLEYSDYFFICKIMASNISSIFFSISDFDLYYEKRLKWSREWQQQPLPKLCAQFSFCSENWKLVYTFRRNGAVLDRQGYRLTSAGKDIQILKTTFHKSAAKRNKVCTHNHI